jgi:hypothetical protein
MYVKRNEERGEVSADEIRQTGLKLNDLYSLVVASATVTANADVTEENQTQVANAIRFINTQNEHIDYQYRYYIGSSTGGTEAEGGTEGSEGSDNGSSSSSGSNGSNGSSGSNGSNGSSQNSGAGGASSGGDNGGGSSYVL